MNRESCLILASLVALGTALSGCTTDAFRFQEADCQDLQRCLAPATEIELPVTDTSHFGELIGEGDPRRLADAERLEYWDLPLPEAMHLALRHSKVMQDLGGTVLRAPDSVATAFGPAVQETDPQFGVEAALSAFDAELSTSIFLNNNDRRLNNTFLGDNGFLRQDFDAYQAQIVKRGVTGSQFAVRHVIEFDRNNNPGNEFKYPNGTWDALLEGEFRHPLLQGGGVEFNRIAGPGARPGVYNGVLIARLRTDISLTDFEIGIRDLVSNVENAYWDLYFAYRDLDTKVKARNASLETWRQVQALYATGKKGGEAEKEAQAREQYFRFQEEVQNALMGRPVEGTRTNNGSTPGTFRATPGVYANERRLRLLIGLPPNDHRLLRPADEPPVSPMEFDWCEIATEALVRREELRRQRWHVKSRELELVASKNFLLPNFDLVGRYRWRGFGNELLDPHDGPRFDNAYGELTSGDFQEWQVGAELSLPIGFRQAHAAVRNAQLRLARARCVLLEQERQVVHDLSAAVAERNRAYDVLQTDINRVEAARQQLQAVLAAYEADKEKADFYVVLDAQRRYAEAESRYFQSRVEYALAIRNVFFERGALLDYCGISLAEGSWPQRACRDAATRERLRGPERSIDYRLSPPPVVSTGQSAACVPAAPEPVPAPAPDPLPGDGGISPLPPLDPPQQESQPVR